jgi:aerobic carbon-monoxide dehydrogenase medium subunit
MIPAAFDYAAASSVEEAIQLLQTHGDEAKLLAGGHSLIPLMKLRLAAPGILIDLGRIPDLSYIRDGGDHIAVGALTKHHALETSELVRRRLPLLSQAASMVGDMQVRNRGTIGGSVSHADPASDLPTIVTALGATVIARGPNGNRAISAEDFFVDIWTSALQPTEVVTEIRFPLNHQRTGQHYEKFHQRAADWALVGAAVSVTRQNGSIGSASVVLTNVGNKPMRATSVEKALAGQSANADVVRAASENAADGLEPSSELRASADYKRHLARVLTRRALEKALEL